MVLNKEQLDTELKLEFGDIAENLIKDKHFNVWEAYDFLKHKSNCGIYFNIHYHQQINTICDLLNI